MQRFYRLAVMSVLGLFCQWQGTHARAQSDAPLYTDQLVNGWQNWSWNTTLNFDNASPVQSGSRSIQVTYDQAWAGLYFGRPNPFSTLGYQTLSFWIHGGATNGRTIYVKPAVNFEVRDGVALNAYVEGGQVRAGEWRRVQIPLTALHIANRNDLTGIVLQELSGGAQPTFFVDDVKLIAAPPPATVNLSVTIGQTVRFADARVLGVNAAVWDDLFDTPGTVALLRQMGNRVLRFPGGSLSNGYHWRTNTTDNNTWQWATSFDKFANVARQTNAQVFISVNYGSGTPEEAADWVRYSNVTKGYGFRYWEIGNENYGSWEKDLNNRPHDPYTYGVRARDYIAQMKAADPTIKVGVVVITGEDSFANYTDRPARNPRTGVEHNGWTPVLLTTLRTLNVIPDFVIYHRYEQGPWNENDAFLLQSARTWQDDAANLRQMLTDYLGPAGASVELVCTELNSVYTMPGKQTTSLVNALYMADSIGQLLQTEFNALVWWNFRNGLETTNNNDASLYGWRQYGNYGMLLGQTDPYPHYYAASILTRFARGGDRVLPASSDYSLLSVYATQRRDLSLRLLVVNKSPTHALSARLSVAPYLPSEKGVARFYGIPQDEAARTGQGSREVQTLTFPVLDSVFSYTFPPYSITMLTLFPGKIRVP
jgi:hypothetical protein